MTSDPTTLYEKLVTGLGIAPRAAQLQIVDELSALSKGTSISIDAPTGSGKSLAALLTGVVLARRGERTLIGTSTVILSEQYRFEMARVRSVFPDVNIFVLKGATHFYCPERAKENLKHYSMTMQAKLESERRSRPNAGVPWWGQANSEACRETCRKKDSKGNDLGAADWCEYEKARDSALTADVVVTTHAMIAADMRLAPIIKKHILGGHKLVIIDEAHKARSALVHDGSVSARGLKMVMDLATTARVSFARRGSMTLLFEDLYRRKAETRWGVTITPEFARTMLESWFTASDLMELTKQAGGERVTWQTRSVVKNLVLAREALEDVAEDRRDGIWPARDSVAVWVSNGAIKVTTMTPESGLLTTLKTSAVGWISATVGTHSRPTYVTDSLNWSVDGHVTLPTPFRWNEQLGIKVVTDCTDEVDLITGWTAFSAGGTCILVHSHNQKSEVASALEEALGSALTVLRQAQPDDANRHVHDHDTLLRFKRAAGRYALVGTDKFGTGVDVPGPALSTLVLRDLPPLRVDGPYSEWRVHWLRSTGRDPIAEYLVPERAMLLEQQVGRAIRSDTDIAAVLIIDGQNSALTRRIVTEALARFSGHVELRDHVHSYEFTSWCPDD